MNLIISFKEQSSALFRSNIEDESLSFLFAKICVFLIPVYTWYIPPFMILWVVVRIIEVSINYKNTNILIQIPKTNLRLFALFLVFFILQLLSLTYSENLSSGFGLIFSRLSMLLFPIVLFFPGKQIENKGKALLQIFAFGTTLFLVFCFLNASIKSISFETGHFTFNPHPPEGYWMSYFYGSFFSGKQHPSYVAMFALFSLIVALKTFLDTNLKKSRRIFWLLSGFTLITSLYFLSSRISFLVLLIIIPSFYFIMIGLKKSNIKYLVFVLLFLIVSILIAKTNERVRIVMSQFSDGTIKEKIENDSRTLIWKSALKIIKENPVLGVGVGDVRDELMKEYTLIGDKDLLESRYNAHNQFLEIALEGGVISLIIFLIIIGYMVYISIIEKKRYLLLFIIIIVAFFMSETVLYRLSGITFFSLFSFLLLNIQKTRE